MVKILIIAIGVLAVICENADALRCYTCGGQTKIPCYLVPNDNALVTCGHTPMTNMAPICSITIDSYHAVTDRKCEIAYNTQRDGCVQMGGLRKCFCKYDRCNNMDPAVVPKPHISKAPSLSSSYFPLIALLVNYLIVRNSLF